MLAKKNEISDLWEELFTQEKSIGKNEYLTYETDYEINEFPVFLALDYEYQYHVLIKSNRKKVIEDQKSKGVKIIKHELLDGDDRLIFIDIFCADSNYKRIYNLLIQSMINEILIKKPLDVNKTCLQILSKWRKFFNLKRKNYFNTSIITGLFGELIILKDILQQNSNGSKYWIGPEGSTYDFQNERCALEVKSTTKKKALLVEIHGFEQLEKPNDTPLYLSVIKLEKTSLGIKILDLIEEILDLVIFPDEILDKLEKLGIFSIDEPSLEEYQYEVKFKKFYLIDKKFPKIIKDSFTIGKIPSGIVDIKYTIDLSNEPPYPLDDKQIQNLYNSFN